MVEQTQIDLIEIPHVPDITDLIFRGFRGDVDYPHMVAVILGSKDEDGIERSDTVEEMANHYAHLNNCDLNSDLLIAEIDGEVVGYQRVTWWQEEATSKRIYGTGIGFLLPEWRRMGIGTAMLRWAEERLREIAAGHPDDGERLFENWASDTEVAKHVLLEGEGYKPITYGAQMVRPDLDDIPDLPLPDGLEVRPVRPEHYRAIWEADKEAFRDHWGYAPPTEEDYQQWLHDPVVFQPELWKIAWDGSEVAGQVRSFINQQENEDYSRLRGYAEFISVRRPWRRRGLARALIAMSLRELKARGMEEAALGVHTENPNGAFNLYQSLGFQVVKMFTTYRKPMN